MRAGRAGGAGRSGRRRRRLSETARKEKTEKRNEKRQLVDKEVNTSVWSYKQTRANLFKYLMSMDVD